MIELTENPVQWLCREKENIDAQVTEYSKDSAPINRDLYIFENGRRYERMLIEEAMRQTRQIELPRQTERYTVNLKAEDGEA